MSPASLAEKASKLWDVDKGAIRQAQLIGVCLSLAVNLAGRQCSCYVLTHVSPPATLRFAARSRGDLETLRACRRVMIQISCKVTINGPVYLAADAVMRAIDGLAAELTGDREYFWLKPAPSKSVERSDN